LEESEFKFRLISGVNCNKVSWTDFFVATIADWHRCEIPNRDPDFVSYSGSAYWDCKNKVRRLSDHWGIVASCRWLLEGQSYQNLFVCGECYYEDFHDINRSEIWLKTKGI
jgi:hypothetical protein